MSTLYIKSKWVKLSICLMVMLGTCTFISYAQETREYPYDKAEKPTGIGSEQNPYLINNIYHILWIAREVNSGKELLNKYFVQEKDIDMSPSSSWSGGEGWMPIGGYYYSSGILKKLGFRGIYDGRGHKILNLKINRPDVTYQALFGYIYTGKVCNLTLENVEVTGLENVGAITSYMHESEIINSKVIGAEIKAVDYYVGGITGYQDQGIIKDCLVEGNIEGQDYVGGIASWINEGKMEACTMRGAVKGIAKKEKPARLAGGIACYTLRSTITQCISYADVSSDEKVGGLLGAISSSEVIQSCVINNTVNGTIYVGGLLGENDNSKVIDCFAHSKDVNGSQNIGGLIGSSSYSDSRVTNCYAVTKVTAEDPTFAGGLIGVKSTGIVSNCYWNKDLANQDEAVGGFYHEDIQCEGKTTNEMKAVSTYSNWDFNKTWSIQPERNDGYPILKEIYTSSSISQPVLDTPEIEMLQKENVFILSTSEEIAQIQVFNMSGILLKHDIVCDREYVVSLHEQPEGIYIIQVFFKSGQQCRLKIRNK